VRRADDEALDFAVAALSLHGEPLPVRRAVQDALLAQVLINDRELSVLLRRAWDLLAQAGGAHWPHFAGAVFEQACALLDLASEAR
jgi:hypothetical protein